MTALEQVQKEFVLEALKALLDSGTLTLNEVHRHIGVRTITLQRFTAVLPSDLDKDSSPSA